MTTRRFLCLAGLSAAVFGATRLHAGATEAPQKAFPVTHTPGEWRKLLTPDQYAVLREAGTERPFTSPLLNEHRNGHFGCAGCNQALFDSSTKFDSGTGWPSFFRPLPNAVEEASDSSLGMDRTEIHCTRCGGHLGHLFDDGPAPTGLRYCMDGVAMNFTPA